MHRFFFQILLALLPTQLGFHFWPQWAMVLGRRVDYLSPTVFLTDILVGLVLVSWLLERIKNEELRMKRPFILLLSFAVLNVLFAQNQPVAIYKWLKVAEFVGLGWYIVRTKPRIAQVVTPLAVGVLYSSVLAIVQFLLQRSVGGPLWWLGERTFDADTPGIARYDFNFTLYTLHFTLFGLRPYATFSHPNVLGGFLAATLPFLLMRQRKKLLYVISLGAGIVALLLTFSRSAIVIGAIAIAAVIFWKRPMIAVLVSVLVFLITYHLSPITFSEESFVVRRQLNAAALSLWQSAPLFGVGLGNFLVRLPEVLPTRTIYFLQPAHNVYLLLLSEVGVVGIGLIVVWNVIRSKTSKTSQKQNKLVLLVPLLTILLLGVVDHYPLSLQQGQLLLTLLVAMSLR